MAQVYKVRLPDGRVVTPGEWSSTPLWSTVEIAVGPLATLRAFGYGIGGVVPGAPGNRIATKADTNMEGAGGTLPENEEIFIFSIAIELFRIAGDDEAGGHPPEPFPSLFEVLGCQYDTLVTMMLSDRKEYARAPLSFFPAGMGTEHYNSNVPTQASNPLLSPPATQNFPYSAASNGGVSVGMAREFATPHHVSPGQPWSINFLFPRGSVPNFATDNPLSRIRCRVYADGIRRRPVA